METKQERQLPEKQVKALEFLAETPEIFWKSKSIEGWKNIDLDKNDIRNLKKLRLIERRERPRPAWRITEKGLERLEGG